MTRKIIDERDALRRTVSRQDAEIRRLETELRQHQTITTYYSDRRAFKHRMEYMKQEETPA